MSTNGKPLSKEQLLGLSEADTCEHTVPGWGTVRLRYLSGLDRAELERMSTGRTPDPVKFRTRLLAMSMAKEDGTPMLKDEEAKILLGKRGTATEDLCDAILKVNEIGGDAVEAAKKD